MFKYDSHRAQTELSKSFLIKAELTNHSSKSLIDLKSNSQRVEKQSSPGMRAELTWFLILYWASLHHHSWCCLWLLCCLRLLSPWCWLLDLNSLLLLWGLLLNHKYTHIPFVHMYCFVLLYHTYNLHKCTASSSLHTQFVFMSCVVLNHTQCVCMYCSAESNKQIVCMDCFVLLNHTQLVCMYCFVLLNHTHSLCACTVLHS